MKPTAHLAASAVASTSLYFFTKSMPIAGASLIAGFLVDIDHLIDYFREYGFRTDIREFLRIFYETRFRKLYLVFHSWELIFTLLLLAWLSGRNEVLFGLSAGVLQHLILDQFANGVTPWGYFFTYRVIKRFSMREIVREAVVMKKRKQRQPGS